MIYYLIISPYYTLSSHHITHYHHTISYYQVTHYHHTISYYQVTHYHHTKLHTIIPPSYTPHLYTPLYHQVNIPLKSVTNSNILPPSLHTHTHTHTHLSFFCTSVYLMLKVFIYYLAIILFFSPRYINAD